MDKLYNGFFLILFLLLMVPRILEMLMDYFGMLGIPQEELMPRYLALEDARRKRKKDDKGQDSTRL